MHKTRVHKNTEEEISHENLHLVISGQIAITLECGYVRIKSCLVLSALKYKSLEIQNNSGIDTGFEGNTVTIRVVEVS